MTETNILYTDGQTHRWMDRQADPAYPQKHTLCRGVTKHSKVQGEINLEQ